MPENTSAVPKLAPVSISRNDTELVFEHTEIKRSKEKKGQAYLAPKVTEENVEQVAKWLGKEVLVSMFRGKMNQRFQALMEEASTEADGTTQKPFSLDEFVELAKSFSARGETIEDIKSEIEELNEELSQLDWGGDAAKAAVDARRISERIKSLIIARESKRRNRTPETAATPVAVS